MKKFGTLLASAAVVGLTLSAVPAEARDWRQNQHGKHWQHGKHGKHWRGGYQHRDNGARIALGILGGVIAGAAIASGAHSYPYSYSYPSYGYAYPY